MTHLYLSAGNTMTLRDPKAAGLWGKIQRCMQKMTQLEFPGKPGLRSVSHRKWKTAKWA